MGHRGRQERRVERHTTRTGAAWVRPCLLGVLGVLACWGLATPAAAQISPDEIAVLRNRGATEGWTFTVGATNATRSPLHELCGAVEPPDSGGGVDFDLRAPDRTPPPAFSWLAAGMCPPIRDQRPCSACWAFSAIATLESAILIQSQLSVDLSEQWLVSCTDAGDCTVGWHYDAFRYLKCGASKDPCERGGAVLEADFPYQAAEVPCNCPHPHSYCLDSWTIIASGWGTTEQLKQAVYDHGPVAACVYVNDAFRAYTGGVFNACEDHLINHIVVLVGWDDSLGEHGAWLVRNSWGTDWGEAGYMWIEYTCSRIGYRATYITYQPHDCNGNAVNDHTDIANGTSPDCNNNGVPDACDIAAESSSDVNQNGIPDECEQDCNDNGVLDSIDIASGTSQDCNANAAPDECDIANGTSRDCNTNGIPDSCDLTTGMSHDVNANSVPDECEPDCNHNGLPDSYELAQGTGLDCNSNDLPDDCDIAAGTSTDVNTNNIPDECEPDCNHNSVPDSYDVAQGTSLDCNGNALPDECDIAAATSTDVNANGLPDECEPDCNDNNLPDSYELAQGISPDCNQNTLPDDCDIAGGTATDVNANSVPDECEPDCNNNGLPDGYEVAQGICPDCNLNALPDECDITAGTSIDVNANAIPDECEPDCNTNGVPDAFEIAAGLCPDCNQNTLPDECDIAGGMSSDVNANAIPDECEPDCNHNGLPDAYELALGTSADCNYNSLPDECDIAAATSPDANANGVPDECESDCNGNGRPDSLDLASGTSHDCNGTGTPDECDIATGASADVNADGWPDECEPDCNHNSLPDSYELAIGMCTDCNHNATPDDCDLAAGTGADCNGNGILDACDLASDASRDCNLNRVPDECDLTAGTSADADGNGLPDECDPCASTQWDKRSAADGAARDDFGRTVALAGDTALVGARLDDDKGTDAGAAYVLRFNGATWVQEAKLIAADGKSYDYFGTAVALSGDLAAVGAPLDDDHGINSGSVYIFQRTGSTWSQAAKITPADGAAGDAFGVSVALSDITLLVGANADDDRGTDAGSAYVFVYNGTNWVQQAKFLAADGAAYDNFGVAVALASDTAVIGADLDDDRGANAGAAYVLRRSGTIWTGQGKLWASDGAAGDQFGAAVAISGETALIGAAKHDHNGTDAGAAYVFQRQGSSWVQEARLWASDGAAGDWFGVSVAVSGDMAVVGASHDDDNGSNAGKACVFVRQGATWTQMATLRASDGSAGDELGTGVALSGSTAVLGAFGDDDLGTDAGAVYAFRGLVDCNENAVLDICDLTRGISADVNANGVPDDCEARRGDLNCDGSVDFGDITPFVRYLSSFTVWQASYPGCPALNGDINSDGTYGQLSFGDIDPFVALLTGG